MAVLMRLESLFIALVVAHTVSQDPAWVLPGESVPSDSIRLTALGTGTPNIYKEQVCSHIRACVP